MSVFKFYFLSMLPYFIVGFAVTLAVRCFNYRKKKVLDVKREIVILVFFTFVAGLASQTLIPPEIMEGNFTAPHIYHLPYKDQIHPDLYLLYDWLVHLYHEGKYNEIIKNYVGNIVMFIPFGLCLPYIKKNFGAKSILIGFLSSLFIEVCQLFFNRITDIADVILNTLGAALGYFIYLIIMAMHKKKEST